MSNDLIPFSFEAKELYHARGNQVFVWSDDELSKEELFLTLHQTKDNPISLQDQARVLAVFLNKEFS